MESNKEKKCHVCDRVFRHDESEHNIQKHIESHSYNTPKPAKKKKIMPKEKNTLYSYFVNVPSQQTKDIESTPEANFLGFSSSVQNIGAVTQPSSSISLCETQESPECSSTRQSYAKCNGINLVVPSGSNIYETFPFALLANKNISFENGNFHHPDCASQKYVLIEKAEDVQINKICFDLDFNVSFKKLTKNMVDQSYFKSKTHDINLSHNQMKQRLDKIRIDSNNLKMSHMNMSRKLFRLNRTLGLHERFLILLKQGKVQSLKQLITVALNANRNINYIVNKVVDAINEVYSPNPDQEDKDIAFLILQFGGPALLDICHRAINLPSSSTAYRILKNKSTIQSSIKVSCTDALNNVEISSNDPKYGHMLKIDETFVDSKVRWCPLDNSMYGFCYEHGRDVDLVFNNYEDVNTLAEKAEQNELHVAKEVMVIATSNNSSNEKAQVVLAWPTCSKSEVHIQKNLIKEYSSLFKVKNGAPLLCWATDGDSTRRQIFDSLMNCTLSINSRIYPIISSLKLIDMNVGDNEETVDYDAKHMAKRTRNAVIAPQFLIDGVVLTKQDIHGILKLANRNTHSIDQLVNPEDKQNVSLATDFLISFSTSVKMTTLSSVGFRVASVVPALQILGLIMEGILALYCFVTATIEEQLIYVSTAAHCLLISKMSFGSIIPNQLYHDLISTFENVFFCAAKYQVYHPNEPLLLVLLGTDVLERLFGNMRLKCGHNGFDSLELIYCCRATRAITQILSSHPEWTKDSDKVMKRLSLDYSKPSSWKLDNLKLANVNIKSSWDKGRILTESFIQESGCQILQSIDFFKLFSEQVTMLKPCGKKIGVTELDTDWSSNDVLGTLGQAENIVPQDVEFEIDPGTDLESDDSTMIDLIEEIGEDGRKHDSQLEVNGVWFHKSTILKQTFLGCRVSKDRLRRVQGLSKHVTEKEKNMNLDDVLLPGDAILYFEKDTPILGSVNKITKGGKKVKLLSASEIQDENIFIFVKKIDLIDQGTVFEWSGKTSDHIEIKVSGKQCHSIQPEVKISAEKVSYNFDKSLVFDIGVSINETSPSSSQSQSSANTNRKKCFLCNTSLTLEEMKVHIGKHILKGWAEGRYPCGFCGRQSCQNKLSAPTKKGNEYYYTKVESNCPFYIHHTRRVKKASKRYPCTNYLVKCIMCKADVWSYNMKHHFEDMHKEAESPNVDPQEIELMIKKK